MLNCHFISCCASQSLVFHDFSQPFRSYYERFSVVGIDLLRTAASCYQAFEASQKLSCFLTWQQLQVHRSCKTTGIQYYVGFSFSSSLCQIFYRPCIIDSDHLECGISFCSISGKISNWRTCDRSESFTCVTVLRNTFDNAPKSRGPIFLAELRHGHSHSPMTTEFVGMHYDFIG